MQHLLDDASAAREGDLSMPAQEAARVMLTLAEHLPPNAHAASAIVAGARAAGIDALPLLRAVQGLGLRLGPGEFRALVDDEFIQMDTVRTLFHRADVPKLYKC